MSLLLWFYVINQGNVAASGNVVEVDLQYRNVAADLNLTGPQKVSVKQWGAYHGSDEITAYIDCSGLDKGDYQLPVKLDTVKGALFTSVQPNKVQVTLEELGQKVFTIKQEIKQNPPTGYQLSQAIFSPDRCMVKGDAAVLGTVATVVAPIDLGNVKDIATIKSTLQARDVNGKAITTGIQIVPSSINVNVVLEKKQLTKKMDVKPQLSGKLADGFSLGTTTVDPVQVTVLGDQTRVDALTEIDTEPIDITGKSEDFTQVVDLVEPDGIVLEPTKATIQVKIVKTNTGGVTQ
jgi:Uncharacterized protein conserved in bacteria